MHERYRQTDRQTDGRAIAYSEREREFTFAKNKLAPLFMAHGVHVFTEIKRKTNVFQLALLLLLHPRFCVNANN